MLNLEKLRPSIFLEQILNSILSFMIIREIIQVSPLKFMSNLNTLLVLSYAFATVSRLFLQKSVSQGNFSAKKVLQAISQSIFLRIIFGLIILFITLSLNDLSDLSAILLFLSIVAMDFIRYFFLFTDRIIPSMIGNAISVFVGFNIIIWGNLIYPNPENLLLLWIFLNLIHITFTVLISRIPRYEIPSDLFYDKTYHSNFKIIVFDCTIIQLFQTLSSMSLLYFVPEANAAARIGSQIFLSIPNLLIASTSPFIALYLAKGLISSNSRFNLMIFQLLYFIIPMSLILMPATFLEHFSGSSDRYYLAYQIGFVANGMSLFVLSSFSYGYIQIVGIKRFITYKLTILFCCLIFPPFTLVFLGINFFNFSAVFILILAIFLSKNLINVSK